jgi:Cd2+/Zn2+-exporting ATPase
MVLTLVAIVGGGLPTLRKGWIALRHATMNINLLMSLAVVGAIAIGEWPEAAMVVVLFAIAELIEAHSLDRARNAIRELMAMAPDTATIRAPDGHWRDVDAHTVRRGQIVRVKPGTRIPLDGVIVEGQSSINEAAITGESLPVEKEAGDTVFAGTLNEHGSFTFQVTHAYANTTLARIVAAVQTAQADRAPTQRFIDRFARYYTPAIVVAALCIAAVPPLVFGGAWTVWIYRALVLLIIACPCALVISTPVAVVSGLAAAARRGILVKGGVYLEMGRQLRAVAFDKTGTLTRGTPVVTDVVPLASMGVDDALALAAALDSHSTHPLARAIVRQWESSARDRALRPVTDAQSRVGMGLVGTIDGEHYAIGNRRLMAERGVPPDIYESTLARLERDGKTAIALTRGPTALAIFGVADVPRDTSAEVLTTLRDMGIRTMMFTGDNAHTATVIGQQIGITDVRSDLLPDDKLDAITALRQSGAVGMVGDGVNDAPAMARADIGFAMGAAGTDTALETADVAIMDDDLRKLPEFIRLSRATHRTLIQNIAFALGFKAIVLGLAIVGRATLWMAVFAELGVSLLVVFNGLRLLTRFPKSSSRDKASLVTEELEVLRRATVLPPRPHGP